MDTGLGSSGGGDSGSTPTSCLPGGPGLTNCGASGSESCCTSLEVTGGTFYRTYTNSGDGGTGEADPASVSTFRLDKYLVTVGRYRQFVKAEPGTDAGPYLPLAGSGKHTHLNGGQGLANSSSPGTMFETGWVATDNSQVGSGGPTCTNTTWTLTAGSNETLPINCVDWYEAYAFCIWDRGFLPSEAEWGYAAAGGSQQREYPWGSVSPGTDNQYAIYECYYPTPSAGGPTNCPGALSNIAPVGTAAQGAGLWGQLDLAGEEFEWTLDWYATYVDPCTDCAFLYGSTARVNRGGAAASQPVQLPSSARFRVPPTDREYSGGGIRCARTP